MYEPREDLVKVGFRLFIFIFLQKKKLSVLYVVFPFLLFLSI